MNLHLQGPEYLPLRTFRDDDLLDQGSDPLISVIGSLSDLEEGERLVARMKLLSLGPDWSRSYQEKADRRPQPNPSSSPYNAETQIHRNDGVAMAILGLIALPSLMGYVWIQRGETWKAVLLAQGLSRVGRGCRVRGVGGLRLGSRLQNDVKCTVRARILHPPTPSDGG